MFYGTFQYTETVLSKGSIMDIICKYTNCHGECKDNNVSQKRLISADIGGVYGCFCGASVITLIEMIAITNFSFYQFWKSMFKKENM